MIISIFKKQSDNLGVGIGTGFFITSKIILTAYHNVNLNSGEEISFYTTIGNSFFNLNLINYNCQKDLAKFEIIGFESESYYNLSTSLPVLSQKVNLLGFSVDTNEKMPKLIVNNIKTTVLDVIRERRTTGDIYECNLIFQGFMLNTVSTGGMSGGPIINDTGEVLGVLTGNDRFYRNLPIEPNNWEAKALIIGINEIETLNDSN
ncbi:MAG: serine protease [Bacteroidota bacterium]